MNYNIIPAAIIITLLITLLFSMFARRPLKGLWLFFLILFLATLSGQLWITPFGPVTWGVSWIPLVIVPVFIAFLIIALVRPVPLNQRANGNAEEGAFIVIGIFFWVILILLLISIGAGYYRSSNLVTG